MACLGWFVVPGLILEQLSSSDFINVSISDSCMIEISAEKIRPMRMEERIVFCVNVLRCLSSLFGFSVFLRMIRVFLAMYDYDVHKL